MRVEIKIIPGLSEPYAEIYTGELTAGLQDAADRLSRAESRYLTGMKEERIFLLDPRSMIEITVGGEKVMARDENNSYELRMGESRTRLYEVEEFLQGQPFVRISKSALANVDKIKYLEPAFNGLMRIYFQDGSKDYVSRKYVRMLKAYLGLGGSKL